MRKGSWKEEHSLFIYLKFISFFLQLFLFIVLWTSIFFLTLTHSNSLFLMTYDLKHSRSKQIIFSHVKKSINVYILFIFFEVDIVPINEFNINCILPWMPEITSSYPSGLNVKNVLCFLCILCGLL